MKELEKIKDLIDIERNYEGDINTKDYVICLGYHAFSLIRLSLLNNANIQKEHIFGIEYRIIDCIDQNYIAFIKKDLLGSILREVHSTQHKVLDSILFRRDTI